LKQTGIVIEQKANTAKVLIQRHAMCAECGGCKMAADDSKLEIEAINEAGATVGQWVEVDMDEGTFLQATFIAYGIPLIALLVGIFLGAQILTLFNIVNNHEIYTAIIGFTLMIIAFITINRKEEIIKSKKKYTPVITGITNNKEEV